MDEQNCDLTDNLADKKSSLAIVIARGASVRAWARANGVPERTAYRWTTEQEVRRTVDTWRRNAVGQAIGRMAGRSKLAAKGIERLSETAESEAVRLAALKAILNEQMALAKFWSLEQRMTELEEWRDGLPGVKPGNGGNPAAHGGGAGG